MSLISDTVAGLGTPRYDGAAGTIRTPSGRQETVFWDATRAVWTSLPYISMRQFDNVGMRSSGAAASWKYPSDEESSAPYMATQYGFQIHTVLEPSELIDAGLSLQEHLSAHMGAGDYSSAVPPEIALNWWRLADGDQFLSPPPDNFGVHLVGGMEPVILTRDIYRWHSTGWMNSPAAAPSAGQNWYPEVYLYGSPVSFRNFTGRYRWVGGADVGGSGSSELSSAFPALDYVVSWHRASDIPAADNATVTTWSDYSGLGRHLAQATLSKRPTVRRDSPGALRHVRFSGGWMATNAGINNVQPWAIFLVMRQLATGGAQQVWYANPGAGAPLIYRGDATDQVDVWAGGGGGDLIYHRSSAWPSPWMVWSAVFNGGNAVVWEGTTEVANGAAGTAGMNDYVLGSNPVESLPAHIDVAEIVICASAPTDTQRTNMVNALKARNGI